MQSIALQACGSTPNNLRTIQSKYFDPIDGRKNIDYDYDVNEGGAVSVQLPKVDISDPHLLTDNYSYNQNRTDYSFDEKLRQEKARLGLLFSPLIPFDSLFAYALNQNTNHAQSGDAQDFFSQPEKSTNKTQLSVNSFESSSTPLHQSLQVFDSIPLKSLSSQSLQDLLTRSGWLTPNLETHPLFAQAFLDGKLQPKLDLQSLVDEIVRQSQLVKEKGKTELRLTLKPAELGDIILTLSSMSGLVSITIQASPEAKKLINDQKAELEKALKKANIHFDQIRIEEVDNNA